MENYNSLPLTISKFTMSYLEMIFSIFWTSEISETLQFFERKKREGSSNFTAIAIRNLNLQSNLSGLGDPKHSRQEVLELNCIYCSQFIFHRRKIMTHTFSIAPIFRTDQGCIIYTGDVSTGMASRYGNFLHTLSYAFSSSLMLLCLVFYIGLDKILSKFSLYDTYFKVMFRSDNSETRQISYVQLHATPMYLENCLSISSSISFAISDYHTTVMTSRIITTVMNLQKFYDSAWHACWEHRQRFGAVSSFRLCTYFLFYSIFVYGILATCPRF